VASAAAAPLRFLMPLYRPRGGARPGAGRPPKSVIFESQVRKAEKRIADRLPHIVDKLLELCDGVLIQQEDEKTGELHVYTRGPDRAAAAYLLDRIMGRPTERVDLEADVSVAGDSVDQLSDDQRAAIRATIMGLGPGSPD